MRDAIPSAVLSGRLIGEGCRAGEARILGHVIAGRAVHVTGLADVGSGVPDKPARTKGIQLAVHAHGVVGVAGVAGETGEDGLALAGEAPGVALEAAAGHLVEARAAAEAVHLRVTVAAEAGGVAVSALVEAEVCEELVGEAGATAEASGQLEASDTGSTVSGKGPGAGGAGLEASPACESGRVLVEAHSTVLDAESAREEEVGVAAGAVLGEGDAGLATEVAREASGAAQEEPRVALGALVPDTRGVHACPAIRVALSTVGAVQVLVAETNGETGAS